MTTLIDTGVVGVLIRDDLTLERLGLSLSVVAAGATTMMMAFYSRAPAVTVVASPELTSREQRVLALVADGLPAREIGVELHYSERTV